MKTKQLLSLLQIAAIVIVVIGFRLATQAGQDMSLPQNDGYAASGGILILIGGAVLGATLATNYRGRKDK